MAVRQSRGLVTCLSSTVNVACRMLRQVNVESCTVVAFIMRREKTVAVHDSQKSGWFTGQDRDLHRAETAPGPGAVRVKSCRRRYGPVLVLQG
jgi:hypothetical protein